MPFKNDLLYPLIELAVKDVAEKEGGPVTREQTVDRLMQEEYVLRQAEEDDIAPEDLGGRLLHHVDFFNANMTKGNEYAQRLNRARVDGRYVLWPKGTSGERKPEEGGSLAVCFVMQPFDGGPYDRRYDEVLDPAIRAANVEPYRVDLDPGVAVPIEDLEEGIRGADICLADITQDNPNVWMEVGFARALNKPLVMICHEDRARIPFDVHHRLVVRYETESPSDFKNLSKEVTERMSALLREGASRALPRNGGSTEPMP